MNAMVFDPEMAFPFSVQLYESGAEPPDTFAVTVSFWPTFMFELLTMTEGFPIESAEFTVTLVVADADCKSLSVAVTAMVFVPGTVALNVIVLVFPGTVFPPTVHANVYGPLPPETFAVIVSFCPTLRVVYLSASEGEPKDTVEYTVIVAVPLT